MVSVTRSTEIAMGLGLDIVLTATAYNVGAEALDFTSVPFLCKVLGSALVMLGAMAMPFSNRINEKFCMRKEQENSRTEQEWDLKQEDMQ